MKKILYFIGTLILFSCNMSDYGQEITENYHWFNAGKNYNYIYGKHNILPNVIKFAHNENFIIVYQKPDATLYKNLFASNLSSDYYCYDYYMRDSLTEKFAKSRNEILQDSVIFKIFKNKGVSFENSSEDIKKSEAIADSIIENNPVQKKIFSLEKVYWIIELKGDVLFGPLTHKELEAIKKKKNIDLDFE